MFAVVLTFDRLPCAALGCYGNEWIDTPHFDRLAAEGFVFDAHVASSLHGTSSIADAENWSAAAGVDAAHIREDRAQWHWPGAPKSEVRRVLGRDGVDASPREWPFSQLLQAGQRWLAESAKSQRRLLWLHSAGIPLPCLVPPDVEALYVDEFADRGIVWSDLSETERAQHPIVQAAYASCMDHVLGEFLETFLATGNEPKLMVIGALFGGRWQTVPRRCALPEELESQRLRTPCLWWTASHCPARPILSGRSPAIVQPIDLAPTLLEWFDSTRATEGIGTSLWPIFDGAAQRIRDAAFIDDAVLWTETDVTVFTDSSRDPATVRRFLWPEDLWQVSDVASLAPNVLAERIHHAERMGLAIRGAP
jgi:hypothetical protein